MSLSEKTEAAGAGIALERPCDWLRVALAPQHAPPLRDAPGWFPRTTQNKKGRQAAHPIQATKKRLEWDQKPPSNGWRVGHIAHGKPRAFGGSW